VSKETSDEEKVQSSIGEIRQADSTPEESALENRINIAVNRSAQEIVFRDPKTGTFVTVPANITEVEDDEDDEDEIKPLTADEFQTALKKVDDLGLTWSADQPPVLRTKEGVPDEVLFSDELDRIQDEYPYLPREIGAIVHHVFTGHELPDVYGSKSDLEKKVAIVRESILTDKYSSEFFFKHAIKVPYLTDIDWEVVLKVRERNIKVVPGILYALLSLEFRNPNTDTRSAYKQQTFTVAVNEQLIGTLIDSLTDLKTQLEASQNAIKIVNKQSLTEGEQDANSKDR
jgi:hypothetical protein